MMDYPSDRRFDNVTAFANAVWGHPETVLKRDDHIGVDYIDLTHHMDAFRLLFGAAVWHNKILIREEYRIAMHELEANQMYHQGAYVTGHPGIGKTLFLAYVLISHLAQRRPVAWKLSNGLPFYILFTQTATLHSTLDTNPLLDHHPLVWALSDSNAAVTHPDPIFYNHVKTILSTPPRRECWKGLSKYGHAECYIMDIWSEKEIIDLAKLLDLPVERMTALAKSWGGVPRSLLRFLNWNDIDIKEVYFRDAQIAVQTCWEAISEIGLQNIVEDGRSNFFFSRPDNREGMSGRMFAKAHVQTPTLRRFLGEALRQHINATKLNFFRALSVEVSSHVRQVAEFIYESWFHVYVSAASTMQCHWVQGLDGVSSLTGTSTVINAALDAAELAKPAYYWVAPKNFPGIDSALVLDKAIYAFQTTVCPISPRRESPLDGLRMLRDHLPADLKDLPWSVVFVGTCESEVESVARRWVNKKLFFPTDQTQLSIGWSEVDPVMPEWVPYTEIRDGPDPRVVTG